MNMNENRYHSNSVAHIAQSSRTRNPPDRGSSNEARQPWEAPVPHFNFARNSLATPSNFESTSLKFCGFLPIVNLSDHQITCEIDGEPRWPTSALHQPSHLSRSPIPTLPHLNCRHRVSRRTGPHTLAFHKPARTNIEITGSLRSVGKHSRHNRRIVTACAHLCRWSVRSHFALQLLGF